ncbi:MAG: Eco29kI family restriction endonuclease [Planctomycetes bacterium]|nr:Eco29kI family restriction endonuclease [Planctomycetota bacterium]
MQQVPSLDIADFYCRHLIVDEEWIRWGESMLIDRFKPVWNVVLDGFGNHDPGKDRYQGMKPAWDTVHPGRSWAGKLRRNKRSATTLRKAVWGHLQKSHGLNVPKE